MLETFNRILAQTAKNKEELVRYKSVGQSAIEEYGEDIYRYVDGNLEAALTAKLCNSIEVNNYVGEALNRKILQDREYRNVLVTMISVYALRYSLFAYKMNLNAEDRRTVFMRNLYSFLGNKQIFTLAEHFDKQLSLQKAEKQTR